jgi:hypothetical protein
MKQRISIEQLQELTGEQQQRLREWWKPQEGDWYHDKTYGESYYGMEVGGYDVYTLKPAIDDLPLLNIGQMIELLENKNPSLKIENNYYDEIDPDSFIWGVDGKRADNFCDALWNAVKKVL